MNQHIISACFLLLGINIYGVLYSFFITKHLFLNKKKIQPKNIDYNTLLGRLPLVSFNVSILILFNVIGLYFFEDYFIREYRTIPWLIMEGECAPVDKSAKKV